MTTSESAAVGQSRKSVPDAPETAAPKLRADAQANRIRIIEAAKRLFASRGLDITLDDVAREAGVGVGTVYRRFANKDALIEGVFVDKFETVAVRARASNDIENPLDALLDLMSFACEQFATDRGFGALAMRPVEPSEVVRAAKAQLESAVTAATERALRAGVMRPELTSTDFFLAFSMVIAVAEYTEDIAPGTWRRAAAFVVDGLRIDGAKLPLQAPPLTSEQLEQMHLDKHERVIRCQE